LRRFELVGEFIPPDRLEVDGDPPVTVFLSPCLVGQSVDLPHVVAVKQGRAHVALTPVEPEATFTYHITRVISSQTAEVVALQANSRFVPVQESAKWGIACEIMAGRQVRSNLCASSRHLFEPCSILPPSLGGRARACAHRHPRTGRAAATQARCR